MVINCIQHLICKCNFCVLSCTSYFIHTLNFISVKLWPLVQDILDHHFRLQILISLNYVNTTALCVQHPCLMFMVIQVIHASPHIHFP